MKKKTTIEDFLPVGTAFRHIETPSNYPVYWSISLGVFSKPPQGHDKRLVFLDFAGRHAEYGFQVGSYMDQRADKCFEVAE